MKLSCQHASTCLPDYWGGHRLPHVGVSVWRGMTPKQLRDAIRAELSHGAVMGRDDTARLLSADAVRPNEEKRADALTRAAYAAVARDVKPARLCARRLFLDLPPDENSEVQAYFVFTILE